MLRALRHALILAATASAGSAGAAPLPEVVGVPTSGTASGSDTPAPWAADAPDRRVTLLATGPLVGATRATQAINSPTLLLDRYASLPVQVTVERSGPDAWVAGRRILLDPEGALGAADLRRLVGEEMAWGPAAPTEILRTAYTVIFTAGPPRVRDLTAEMWRQNEQTQTIPELERMTGSRRSRVVGDRSLVLIEMPGAEGAGPPSDPAAWERRGLLVSRVQDEAGVDHLMLVRRPLGDPGRMLAAAAQAKRDSGAERTLLLDPGTAWPRGLTVDERRTLAERRAAAGFDAIVPSASDLADGPAGLVERRDRAGLPLVAANLHVQGVPLLAPSVVRTLGDREVAVIGLVGPGLPDSLPRPARQALTVSPAAPAAQAQVDALLRRPRRPDVIVLLGALSATETASLRDQVVGADVIFGDWTRPGLVAAERQTRFAGRTPAQERRFLRSPAVVVRANAVELARVDLTFADETGGGVRAADSRTEAVTDSTAPDPFVRALLAARQERMAQTDTTALLPDLQAVGEADPELAADLRGAPDLYPTLTPEARAAYPLRFTDSSFTRLSVNAIRAVLGAEVAAIRPIVRAGDAPGEVSAGAVARWLEGQPDRLLLRRMDGDALRRLHDTASPATWSGLVVRGKDLYVQGRPLRDDEPYLLAIADSLLPADDRGPGGGRFRRSEPGRYVLDEAGEPLTLRGLVPTALFDLGLAQDSGALGRHLRVQGDQPRPGFRLRVREIDVRGGALNAGSPGRAEFSDARVAAGQAMSLGASGDVLADVFGESWMGTAGLRFQYDAQVAEGAEFDACASLADDWVASAEVRNSRWTLPVGFDAKPYVALAYDSQFLCAPRQAQLFYGVGAGGSPGFALNEVRVGAAVRHDLRTERAHPGAQASARGEAEVLGVLWSGVVDLDWFPRSDSSALELDVRLTNALDLALGGGLSLRARLDTLGYALGESAGEGVRHSLTFGLAYGRVLKPQLGLW